MNAAQIRKVQSFFATRAAGWEERFPDDVPRYARAVRELAPPADARVLDVGCGTGRALPLLRKVVGPQGLLVGLDATSEMLAEASRLGRGRYAALLLADGERLPFRDGAFDAIFAAGFVPHLTNPVAGLAELARVTASNGRLAIFHPISRAALAARHGGMPSDDDVLAPAGLEPLLSRTGWRLEAMDDGAERYLVMAVRDLS